MTKNDKPKTILSRHMPKEPSRKPKWWGVLIVAIWAGWLIWSVVAIIVHTPLTSIGFALFAVVIATASILTARKLKQLRSSRRGEDIGSFSRSLPIRQLDTWVVRAVYEEISAYVGTKDKPFPIRPTDRLAEDLEVDQEDLGDMICSIADRCGRSLGELEKNPIFTTMKTITDVIQMLMLQPKQTMTESTTATPLAKVAG